MLETLVLADARILLWLNHRLAASPPLYQVATFLSDEGADIALALTACWLWFWPAYAGKDEAGGRQSTHIGSRQDSRARLIVFGLAAMAAYILARLIAIAVEADRPFVTYLPVRGIPGSFEGLRAFGSFPSDHAALLGALPVAFFYWRPWLGWLWTALAVGLIGVRIAIGFHYPSDMLAGALLGMILAAVGMGIYDRRGWIHRLVGVIAGAFARRPHAYLLYSVLALIAVEFAMHFTHVLGGLAWLYYRLA